MTTSFAETRIRALRVCDGALGESRANIVSSDIDLSVPTCAPCVLRCLRSIFNLRLAALRAQELDGERLGDLRPVCGGPDLGFDGFEARYLGFALLLAVGLAVRGYGLCVFPYAGWTGQER